jgi:hypothetical protein
MTYTRPVGKAYVKKGRTWGKWMVLGWRGPDMLPRTWMAHIRWVDAVDTALWYNETYYHPYTKETTTP